MTSRQPPSASAHRDASTSAPLCCHRSYDRFPWQRRVQVAWIDEHGPSEPVILEANDLSAGGIGLVSRNMIYPHTVGMAMLCDAHGRALLRCLRVIHCRYESEIKAHVVGAQWLPMPLRPLVRIVQGEDGPRLAVDASSRGAA